jgi:hypothetical protein
MPKRRQREPEPEAVTLQQEWDGLPAPIQERFLTATCSQDPEVALLLIRQLGTALRRFSDTPESEALRLGLQLLEQLKAKTIAEALLGVQMLCAHQAALHALNQVNSNNLDVTDSVDELLARSTRLMRLSLSQAETWTKLQGRISQQKMVVEHIGRADTGTDTGSIHGAAPVILPAMAEREGKTEAEPPAILSGSSCAPTQIGTLRKHEKADIGHSTCQQSRNAEGRPNSLPSAP